MTDPNTSTIGPTDVFDTISSFASAMKIFESVITHEPRSAPVGLPLCAFFSGAPQGAPGGFRTIPRLSDLTHAALRMDVLCRIYHDALESPIDDLDSRLLEEVTAVMRACHQEVSLGLGAGVWTDAQGKDSDGLNADLLYIDHDQRKFRCAQIYIPVIITNFFPQGV